MKAMKALTPKNIRTTFLVVLLIKLFALIKGFGSENAACEFIKAIPKEYEYCEKVMNKNLIISEEEEHLIQQSNTCRICEKLIDNDDKKVRDHCHVTGKFRGSAHWICNINLQLTKKVPIIFHNLRGYDSQLIFCELNKFDVKIPNGFEKYMAFFFFFLEKKTYSLLTVCNLWILALIN